MKKNGKHYESVLSLDQVNRLIDLGLEFPEETLWSWQKEIQSWSSNANDPSDYSLVLSDEISIGGLTKYHRLPTLNSEELLDILPGSVQTCGIDYYMEIFRNMSDELTVRYMKNIMGEPLLVRSGKKLLDVCYEAIVALLENDFL